MKKKYLVSIVCILLFFCLSIFIYRIIKNDKNLPNKYYTEETADLSSNTIVLLDKKIKTPTGITYNDQTNSFWICDFEDINSAGSIYELDEEFSTTNNKIDLSSIGNASWNLQGITYDKKDNTFWIAVGESIVEINAEGKILRKLSMPQFRKNTANGIAYDSFDDSIWVLCYDKLLLKCTKDGQVIKIINSNIKDQDLIYNYDNSTLLGTAGADYQGKENYVISFKKNTGEITAKYRLLDSYAVEGIVFHNSNLYIVNDGIFHNAKYKENYITCYTITSDK